MLLSPVQRSERIQLLDVLRGFAILGIFLMNLDGFTLYWTLTPEAKSQVMMAAYDHRTEFMLNLFFEGKFYSIFSMLFGIGFAIYLNKAGHNSAVLKLFRRRLLILFLIGFLHLLFWVGDIVAFYAIIGFVLIPFRRFNNRTLLILAGMCILSPIAWYALKMNVPQADLSVHLYDAGDKFSGRLGITSIADVRNAYHDNNFGQFIKLNAAAIFYRYGDLVFQSRFFKVFGMFLLGLVIGRSQFYNKINENRKLLWRIFLFGLLIGIPANYAMATLKNSPGYGSLTFHGLKQTIAYALGVVPLALAYAAGLTLFYYGSGKGILNLLAPVGKMALSNYLLQTAIGLILFTGLGFAMPPIGPTSWTILGCAVFIGQIFLSYTWLRFFNFGPIEWLWRSATYGRWQRLKKANVPL